MTTDPQPKPPPTGRSTIPERVAIGAMAIAITAAAAVATTVLLTQPAPILIELAPAETTAADGDSFAHSHDDHTVASGMFPHLERNHERAT